MFAPPEGATTNVSKTMHYTPSEIDAKLRRAGRPENLFKADLPTPALVVDLDQFESNVALMAEHAKKHGKQLRPHAKTNKCVDVAKRQRAAGAIGVCVATVPEALVMARGGIDGILLTSPIAMPYKAALMVELASTVKNLMVTVENPQQVAMYNEAADAAGTRLDVLVDLNVGDRRTGITPGEAAAELGEIVNRAEHLRLRGLQAYSGTSSHVMGFAARQEHTRKAMGQAVATRELFQKRGLPAEILSGASTGTHDIDCEIAAITELQTGSYVFMDVDYRRIGGTGGALFDKFAPALGVVATVVSTTHRDRVTLDSGFKSMATDRPFGPEPKDVTGVSFAFGGDEFGYLSLEKPSRELKLGTRVEFIVPHCDPTVNLYDRIYACRGEKVEEIWSVMDRLRAFS